MSTLSWQNRLYGALLRESQKSDLQRHCAYLAAGWLSLFMVRPQIAGRRDLSFSAVAGGGALLLVVLMLVAGPVLNLLQPAFRAAGRVPAGTWVATWALALLVNRYLAGRRILTAFAAA
jgi:hypothetical protein